MLKGVGFDEGELVGVPDLDVLAVGRRDKLAVARNLHASCRALGLQVPDGLARPDIVQPGLNGGVGRVSGDKVILMNEQKGTQGYV